jgi:D-aminoacyl-tRNA deacylase
MNLIKQMRAVIQRVSEASVKIDNLVNDKIGLGLLVLLGIEEQDSIEDIEWLSGKIVRLRIFNDAEDVMNLSVKEINGEILVVSQFTLHASTKKGNRPSYIKAAKLEIAIPLYNQFLDQLAKDLEKPVQSGVFGAMMEVSLVNDGPVTILMDTKQKE